ncbi:MAG: tyrosine-type recombinase/integrase [Actinomycetota bacterium]|nr:tyrosine-type recombinase/integrase [Actinomycetota bacterium]
MGARRDVPWTPAEALAFLKGSRDDPLYAAFVLLLLYGMRRGEALGLRWQDIDFDRQVIRIGQQVHRAGGRVAHRPGQDLGRRHTGSRDVDSRHRREQCFPSMPGN